MQLTLFTGCHENTNSLAITFHIRKPQPSYLKPDMLDRSHCQPIPFTLLLRNLDCDRAKLHAPLPPSAAHKLLVKVKDNLLHDSDLLTNLEWITW